MTRVPAWQVQSGSYSDPDYVFILLDELDSLGWPKTKLVSRLTPVDAEEQQRLQQIVPEWAR